MTRTITVEYIAEENSLKLSEPLEGVEDHEKITILIPSEEMSSQMARNETRETVSPEAGRSLDAAIEEVFGAIGR